MGKKRIKVVDQPISEKKESPLFEKKKIKKAGKGEGRLADMSAIALAEAEKIEQKKKEEEKELEKVISQEVKKATPKKIKSRSKLYKLLKSKIDKNKLYPPEEAVSLLLELAKYRKTDQTVELHISTNVDKLTGTINFPYSTGKKQKIAIADDKLIEEVSNGKIDFDILIATPQMMPKIAKIAKILGPKGLMPNPKTGTITNNPEELKKKMESGETRFKTEAKAPLIHLAIGKISLGKEKILANLKAAVDAIKLRNIKNAFICSTQSPSIKLLLK